MSDEMILIRLQERHIKELEERQRRHLDLIARMSRESVTDAEATEMRAQIASMLAEIGTLRNRLETCYGAISIHERRAEGLREEIRNMDATLMAAMSEAEQRREEANAWETALKTLAESLHQAAITSGHEQGHPWVNALLTASELALAWIQRIDPDYELPETNKELTCQE